MDMFKDLKTPFDIQEFMNSLDYRAESVAHSPKKVFEERKAHCFDGAVFAAAALENLGYPPLILDLVVDKDDDHILAVFKDEGWGAIAKSNTSVLRFREPVYKSIRELVMTYFDMYFNIYGYKCLRTYSKPINLRRFDRFEWRTTDKGLDFIEQHIHKAKHYDILTEAMIKKLAPADKRLMDASFFGADTKLFFDPEA